jgi:hypothetical protein
MSNPFIGRYAALSDEPFIVFLVGVTVHQPLAIRHWLPVVAAMPPMIRELEARPEKGMMSARLFFSLPSIMAVQYWRSFDHLEAFARAADDLHLPAWKRFNQAVGKSTIVGVFHETYLIKPDSYEAIYVNMERFGLARAVEHVPATGKRLTARRRLGGDNEPAVITPE